MQIKPIHTDKVIVCVSTENMRGGILMVDKNDNISSHFRFQDYIDGFDKLLRLGLKNQQEREIIHIIVDLCLQEKKFNPFYVLLLQKFCLYHRRFQVCFVLCGTMYSSQFYKIYIFLGFFHFIIRYQGIIIFQVRSVCLFHVLSVTLTNDKQVSKD